MLEIRDYEATRAAVLERLDTERREKVEFLLEFRPESAAGLMHLDYVTVGPDRNIEEVVRRVRRHEERTDRFPTTFLKQFRGAFLAAMVSHFGRAIISYST